MHSVEPTIRLARILLNECQAINVNGVTAGGSCGWADDLRFLAEKHLGLFGLGVCFNAETLGYEIVKARTVAVAA